MPSITIENKTKDPIWVMDYLHGSVVPTLALTGALVTGGAGVAYYAATTGAAALATGGAAMTAAAAEGALVTGAGAGMAAVAMAEAAAAAAAASYTVAGLTASGWALVGGVASAATTAVSVAGGTILKSIPESEIKEFKEKAMKIEPGKEGTLYHSVGWPYLFGGCRTVYLLTANGIEASKTMWSGNTYPFSLDH